MALISSTRRYQGRVIHVDHDTVEFPDGSQGVLEMVRHPGASAVAPFLDNPRDRDPRVLLIRQFRHAAEEFIWEVPAGTLDSRESPEECARRELEEETGYRARRLQPLVSIFTTPGFTDERIHLFLATGLTRVPRRQEADEFISVHEVRWSEVGRMIRGGEIRDGKTLGTLMYVNCFVRP